MQTVITIGAVTRKEGTSKKTGKPFTKYSVHDQNGNATYETFDATLANIANEAVGKRANVEFETGQWGNDLKSLVVDQSTPANPVATGALPSQKAPDGTADWDIIGLRKTRCLLWANILGSDAFWSARATMPESQLYDAASKLVEVAEADIYWRDPAARESDIPF